MATVVPLPSQDPADAAPDTSEQSTSNAAVETSPDALDAVTLAELRESQRMLATLLSNLHGMAYRCKNDPDWTMEYVSEGCLELTGYPPSDLINSPSIAYGHLIDPADRTAVWDAVQTGLRTQEPFQITYRLHTAAGTQRWVHERGRACMAWTVNCWRSKDTSRMSRMCSDHKPHCIAPIRILSAG
ncbi:MAG: PAS domain-containing protein [Anaerolineales bacterium]|nr:PAS domain-containing protein [Anaerolineales bacterium]